MALMSGHWASSQDIKLNINDPKTLSNAGKKGDVALQEMAASHQTPGKLGNDSDSAMIQYWTAVIILALFAMIAFAVIISTWKKLKPFSNIGAGRRMNMNEAEGSSNGNLSHSEIIKSQPIQRDELAAIRQH